MFLRNGFSAFTSLLLFCSVAKAELSLKELSTTVSGDFREENIVNLKLVKPVILKEAEQIDYRMTFQDGHRVYNMNDLEKTRPFCEVFLNADEVEKKHGHISTLELKPNSTDGIKIVTGLSKSVGVISVAVSKTQGEAVPEEHSFHLSCTFYSSTPENMSMLSYEDMSKILGKTFAFEGVNGLNTDIARK